MSAENPAKEFAEQFDVEPPAEAPEATPSAEVPEPPDENRSPSPAASSQPRNPDGTFAPSKPSHDSNLVGLALDLGIPQDDIDALDSRGLSILIRRLAKPAPITQDKPAPPAPEDEYDIGIDESQFDPDLVKTLKSQAREIKALKAEREQERAASRHLAAMDAADRLFAEKASVFGKGTYKDVKKESAEFKRRAAVFDYAQKLPTGSMEERLAEAISTLYGHQEAEPEAKKAKTRYSNEEWDAGGSAHPTSRKGAAELPGVEKAKRSVAARLAEMGKQTESDITNDFLE